MTVAKLDTDTTQHNGTYISATDTRQLTPTHKHRSESEPCTVQSNGELDDLKWWTTLPLRRWETQSLDSTQHVIDRSHTMHLILIRHAESENNALTDVMFDKIAIAAQKHTTYNNQHNHTDINNVNHDTLMDQYNLKRKADPDLSQLGYKQAENLIQHPYLCDLNLPALIKQQRVKFICSPMRRAMLTSAPLLKHLNIKATVQTDWAERGGAFESTVNPVTGKNDNLAVPGRGRTEMEAEFNSTHDCSSVPESGWWTSHCKISKYVEEDELFYIRLERLVKYLKQQCTQYALHYRQSLIEQTTDTEPDFLVVMCHADLIDELLSRLLGCQQRRYVFYTINTACAHVELMYFGEDKIEARVRGTNIQPLKIS